MCSEEIEEWKEMIGCVLTKMWASVKHVVRGIHIRVKV